MAKTFMNIRSGVGLKPNSVPSDPVNGDIYYDISSNLFSFYQNGAWVTISTSAASTIGTIDSQTASANGLVIAAGALYAQSASATVPGMVNTGTQTFAGAKTFNGNVFLPTASSGTNTTQAASTSFAMSAANDAAVAMAIALG
jgi:hypothetical protein